MSEFAKQPHPDAAHRERLSREIPGLSPRQVQVWFQNRYVPGTTRETRSLIQSRRAKIKRLTADDLDRVVRMRAVPDGFDNVQALHSPYGGVHGLGIPTSPGDGANASYSGHMLRPVMVDIRRQEEAYMSPNSLVPSFGGLELGHPVAMSSSDIMSPLSLVSSDKLTAESRFSPPLRTAGASVCHQSSLENIGQMGKQGLRQGQPLHIREPADGSNPDSLQSPLCGSVSWRPDTFDYSHYQEANAASSVAARHLSVHQVGHLGLAADSGLGDFEPPYPGEPSWARSERQRGGKDWIGRSADQPSCRQLYGSIGATNPPTHTALHGLASAEHQAADCADKSRACTSV